MVAGLLLALLAAGEPGVTLEQVAAALGASPSWQVEFTQRYVPAGFETGAAESGTLTLAPPASLRFDYAGPQPRVFAADGSVARWLDPGAQVCTAIRIDATTWGRLPLTAFLDPGAARAAFSVAVTGATMTMTAREPTPELASVLVRVGPTGLPAAVTVIDGAGNRNDFTFATWARRGQPAPGTFRPALEGAAPCEPAEE
jgi:outer membrane lipoprotein-sorting protein